MLLLVRSRFKDGRLAHWQRRRLPLKHARECGPRKSRFDLLVVRQLDQLEIPGLALAVLVGNVLGNHLERDCEKVHPGLVVGGRLAHEFEVVAAERERERACLFKSDFVRDVGEIVQVEEERLLVLGAFGGEHNQQGRALGGGHGNVAQVRDAAVVDGAGGVVGEEGLEAVLHVEYRLRAAQDHNAVLARERLFPTEPALAQQVLCLCRVIV